MKDVKLNIGDVASSESKVTYTCFGLGSCIGLFIQDRLSTLSAGAHIALPGAEPGPNNTKFYNVASAIGEIVKQLKSKGSTLEALRAKITGGANVLSVDTSIGARIVDTLMKELLERRIFVAAVDVGGTYCRTAKFESESGALLIRRPEVKEFKIL